MQCICRCYFMSSTVTGQITLSVSFLGNVRLRPRTPVLPAFVSPFGCTGPEDCFVRFQVQRRSCCEAARLRFLWPPEIRKASELASQILYLLPTGTARILKIPTCPTLVGGRRHSPEQTPLHPPPPCLGSFRRHKRRGSRPGASTRGRNHNNHKNNHSL